MSGKATRVAVIGVGHLGKHHARIYAGMENVELAGVVDIQQARAEEIAASHKTRAYTDYHDVMDTVDAVSLAVPTVDHGRIGLELLSQGIDVLVEKPIAASLEEAKQLNVCAAE